MPKLTIDLSAREIAILQKGLELYLETDCPDQVDKPHEDWDSWCKDAADAAALHEKNMPVAKKLQAKLKLPRRRAA
jgi:hypothetical protein